MLVTLKKIFESKKLIIISKEDIHRANIGVFLQLLILCAVLLFMMAFFRILDHIKYVESEYKKVNHVKNKQMDFNKDLADTNNKLVKKLDEINEYLSVLTSIELESNNDISENSQNNWDKIVKNEILDKSEQIILKVNNKIDREINQIENIVNKAELYVAKADKNYFSNQGGPLVKETSDKEKLALDKKLLYLASLKDRLKYYPLYSPMNYKRVSSNYGIRIDPLKKVKAQHNGIDLLGVSKNQIIRSPAQGKVLRAGRNGAYGLFIEIDHGFGFITRYAHLSKIIVKRGQDVKLHDIIGRQGNTGRSTGHHLHYEIRYNGNAINPKGLMNLESEIKKISQKL